MHIGPTIFEQVEWGIKNPSIHIDFKNVYLTLVKSATKKVVLKKRIFFWDLGKFSIGKIIFGTTARLGLLEVCWVAHAKIPHWAVSL